VKIKRKELKAALDNANQRLRELEKSLGATVHSAFFSREEVAMYISSIDYLEGQSLILKKLLDGECLEDAYYSIQGSNS